MTDMTAVEAELAQMKEDRRKNIFRLILISTYLMALVAVIVIEWFMVEYTMDALSIGTQIIAHVALYAFFIGGALVISLLAGSMIDNKVDDPTK